MLHGAQGLLGGIQEADASRTSQVFARSAAKPVAADLGDVQWHLADALAGVKQEGNSMASCHCSYGLSTVDTTCRAQRTALHKL